MYDREPRPVQHLLGQPLLPVLGRVRHLRQAHLRDGHLRDIDERLNVALLARNRGRDDCCLKVRCRRAHAEIDAATTLRGSHHIRGNRQIAGHNLSPGCAQSRGSLVFAMDERADRQVASTEQLHYRATDTAYAARGGMRSYAAMLRNRPDLLEGAVLSKEDSKFLTSIRNIGKKSGETT